MVNVKVVTSDRAKEKAKNDVYYDTSMKNISLALSRVFGIIDAEVEKLHTDDDKEKFMVNFLTNLMIRFGSLNHQKEEFLKFIAFLFDRATNQLKNKEEVSEFVKNADSKN